MNKMKSSLSFLCSIIWIFISISCNNENSSSEKNIAHSSKELEQKTSSRIKELLGFSNESIGKIDDSTILKYFAQVKLAYSQNADAAIWSKGEKWLPVGDSMYRFIQNSKLYGLFPEDYHFLQLSSIRLLFFNDSTAKSDRRNADLWARADLFLTDAFFHIVKDIKLGRLPNDSITLRKDTVMDKANFISLLDTLKKAGKLTDLVHELEPKIKAYHLLKAGIKKFLEGFDNKFYTVVPSPSKDRANYKRLLQKRLYESGFIATDSTLVDSSQLAHALKKFQEKKGLEADGKIGNETLTALNTTDRERFVHIAITMDRFKKLPSEMPEKYIWVNLPAFSLQVWDDDTIKIQSRIVCGKPATRSPVLTSAISELITYPKWTIPTSIIVKEILPGVKKNPKYFQKKKYGVFDFKGNEINPDSVDWTKFKNSIPYHVIQGSGDANALGVMKFNFNNKYAVYLHDTNERYLFSRNDRAMSHGCIRVQDWHTLANFVIDNDDADGKAGMRIDSIQRWLNKKEKRSLAIKTKLPLFIRYFTCEGKNGTIQFYNDIYGEDKRLAEKYFTGK
ncbi:MAG: L,D-transpeptidase family protein [Bacteroidetes bacterium]|nr:L,D-transpeptidase family protein [Bacteroidota bacterium]